MKTAAIIGAGISGLACARRLHDAGWSVTVLEKSRGPGGRTATRRSAAHAYDHGAPCFTARAPAFQAQVRAWEAAGVVAPWQPRLVGVALGLPPVPRTARHPRYVGVPRMSSLARHLSEGLTLQTGALAAAIRRTDADTLTVEDAAGTALGTFSRVVVSTPAAQAAPLLRPAAPHLAAEAEARAPSMAPCLAAMVTFAAPLAVSFDAARLQDGPLAWIARESSKPGRPAAASWVLHASPAWSQAHLALEREEIADALLAALRLWLGGLPEVVELLGHRWRYALAADVSDTTAPFLLDDAVGIGVCGDWLGGPRIEGAWQSGDTLGQQLLRCTD